MDVSILHDDGQGGNRKVAAAVADYAFCPCTAVAHCESETTMVKRADDPEVFRCRKWAKMPGAEVPLYEGEGPIDERAIGTGRYGQDAVTARTVDPAYSPEPVPTSTDVPVATGEPAFEDGSITAAPGPVPGPLEFYAEQAAIAPDEPTPEADEVE